MATTTIVPRDFTVAAALALARDNNAKLIINPTTQQAIVTDGPVFADFVVVYDPTRPHATKRRVDDAYSQS